MTKTTNKPPSDQEIHNAFLSYITSIFAIVVSGIAIIAGAWQGFVARSLEWGYIDLALGMVLLFAGAWSANYSHEIMGR